MKMTRPVIRYHGSKYRIADWVISQFPGHSVYVEPFGGGASVLLRKPRAKLGEIYNDLDQSVVSIFRVLRDPEKAKRLEELLRLTPFARQELEDSYQPTGCPVEDARRAIVRAFQGFGSDSVTRGHRAGFRSRRATTGQNAWPALEWSRYPDAIAGFCERLQGVTIENRRWQEIMDQYDGRETLFYLDPPYLKTRGETAGKAGRRGYKHEIDDADHAELLEAAVECEGMVVISGYASGMYDDALKGWATRHLRSRAEQGLARQETLWIKPNSLAGQGMLF